MWINTSMVMVIIKSDYFILKWWKKNKRIFFSLGLYYSVEPYVWWWWLKYLFFFVFDFQLIIFITNPNTHTHTQTNGEWKSWIKPPTYLPIYIWTSPTFIYHQFCFLFSFLKTKRKNISNNCTHHCIRDWDN